MYNTEVYCLEGEMWKNIPGYEGIYQASSLGRIRSVAGKVTFSERHGTRVWAGRIIKPKNQANMYRTGYRVTLWKDKQPTDWLVARLVASAFLGVSEMTVNHKNGDRTNNNIDNLEWLTLADNIRHAFETGLQSTNKTVIMFYKNELKKFMSMSKAGKYLGRSGQYISGCLKCNKPIKDVSNNEVPIIVIDNNRRGAI